MRKLILIGAGGHGKSVEWIARSTNQWSEILFLDEKLKGPKILGNFDKRKNFKNDDFFVSIGDNLTRKKILKQLQKEGFQVVSIISPNSNVTNSKIGIGSIIMNNVFINVDSIISDGVIINNQVLIEHDCQIGEFTHISPSVNVAGRTQIGELSWIGIGANIINNLIIGNEVIVGAGSVVLNNLMEKGTYVGIPAKSTNKL
jgi:sugar O-acyltransferase (sialic acid O-acetyltransferase NeuD family)